MMDHPLIGGTFTVFVLCYGEYFDLAAACLDSILSTLPIERLDLRIGLNAVCDETRAYVRSLPATKIYEDASNAGKYVIMRTMFHDPECPITTTHLAWFDDDARIVKGSIWQRLADAIVVNHPHGARLYGRIMHHDLTEVVPVGGDPTRWFREATWWRGKEMFVGRGPQTAPNGTFIHFAVGWFWCMATEMIRAADIPDVRLVHNGGDIACGEAVRQAGGKLLPLNVDSEYIWSPSDGRRGKAVLFPWVPIAEWRKAAERGEAAAQSILGNMFFAGEGMPQSYAEAAGWWRRAAEQGEATAQGRLGLLYTKGQGVGQDYAEAAKLYRKAAEQGHGGAQSNLGLLYAMGQGVAQDYAEAARWYQEAANQGDVQAQNGLGLLYEHGHGVPQNEVEAAGWYRKAADTGDRGAQNNLGILHAKGKGVPQDDAQAFMWLSLAAVQGDANAARNRDVVVARMTPSQLEEAKALVAAWKPNTGP